MFDPSQVTLKRAFTTLSIWQKLRFGYNILTFKDSITAEEVEQCKQKDLLESMLEEIAGSLQHEKILWAKLFTLASIADLDGLN